MLEIIGVSKTFNPNTVFEKKALVDINLKVENGEFISIIGANGAGKSTLFNAISGSFLTDKGKIVLDGEDITFLPDHKRARMIGRLFQDPMRGTAPGMSIEENLFNSTSVFFCLVFRNICKFYKKFCEELMTRINIGCFFKAFFREIYHISKPKINITVFFKNSHCTAYTWFRKSQMICNINRTNKTVFVFENQNCFKIIFCRFFYYHNNLPFSKISFA